MIHHAFKSSMSKAEKIIKSEPGNKFLLKCKCVGYRYSPHKALDWLLGRILDLKLDPNPDWD